MVLNTLYRGFVTRRRHDLIMVPELSKQLNRILNEASLFRHLFDAKKQRMQTIENKLRNIANKTNQMHANTNIVRRAGAVGVIMGVILGVAGFIAGVVIVSVFMGVLVLSAGVSTAGFGAAAVVSSFVTKIIMESWTLKATLTMAEEFLSLLNIFLEHLQQIKNNSETLMRNYSSHETVRKRLGISTRETGIFNRELEEIVQLTTDATEAVGEVFDDVLPRLNNIRVMPFGVMYGTPQRDKDLTDIITVYSERCNKTIEKFQKIDNVLSALIGQADPPQNNDIGLFICLLFILMFYFLFNLFVSIMFLHSLKTK